MDSDKLEEKNNNLAENFNPYPEEKSVSDEKLIVKALPERDLEKGYKSVGDRKQKTKQENFLNIIKLVAPGTIIREAVDDIIKSRNGALIVLDSAGLGKIIEGGFRVNCRLTSQRLVELSKMDGAIIISKDMSKILSANTLLVPDSDIPTEETGTRHKAAERTSKQLGTLVIAISERRRIATLYHGDTRYPLRGTQELLRRAVESLQILEKQSEIFNDMMLKFNVLEFTKLVTLNDVCLLIQRAEIIIKIASIIKRHVIELGKESSILKIRLRELMKDVEREEFSVISDFSKLKLKKTKSLLSILSLEELLEIDNIILTLGYSDKESIIYSKGYRILNRLGLPEKEIKLLMNDFQNLNNLLEAPAENLTNVLKDKKKAKSIQERLANLKEQVILGKKI
ncbi:DNA integrity scanning protein DisA [Candidatus Pacearchaeota archaeon]|nr:DNA integrity scanning protein DisA [Candidatus Pacearchaeota archaeon]